MIRIAVFCLLASFSCENSLLADVVVTSDGGIATPGLPGFRTYKLTATSTVPGELIVSVDFVGDPNNNDPVTARGIFGPLNQINLGGVFLEMPGNPHYVYEQDSHFCEFANNVIPIFASESSSFLRAAYAYPFPEAQSLKFAELAIPDGSADKVRYRGAFSVTRDGGIVDTPEVVGFITSIPEPTTTALAGIMIIVMAGGASRQRRLDQVYRSFAAVSHTLWRFQTGVSNREFQVSAA